MLKNRYSVPRARSSGRRLSKTYLGVDVVSALAAVLAIVTGFGLLTPEHAAAITGEVGALVDAAEVFFAAGLGLFAVAVRLFRYVRQALTEED